MEPGNEARFEGRNTNRKNGQIKNAALWEYVIMECYIARSV